MSSIVSIVTSLTVLKFEILWSTIFCFYNNNKKKTMMLCIFHVALYSQISHRPWPKNSKQVCAN